MDMTSSDTSPDTASATTAQPLVSQELDEGVNPEVNADPTGFDHLFGELVNLPKDANSEAFRSAIQVARQYFRTRRNFNLMVCEQLAMRAITPTTALVLEIGKWGSKAHVASDVEDWRTQLANRLDTAQAKIPEAVRKQANDLLESIWNLAAQVTASPLKAAAERMEALQRDLIRTTQESQSHQATISQLEAEIQRLHLQTTQHQATIDSQRQKYETLAADKLAEAAHLNQTIQSLHQTVADLQREVIERTESLRDQHAHETADLLKRLEDSQTQHIQLANQLQSVQAAHDQRLQDVQESGASRLDRLQSDLREALALAARSTEDADLARRTVASETEAKTLLRIQLAKLQQKVDDLTAQPSEALRNTETLPMGPSDPPPIAPAP